MNGCRKGKTRTKIILPFINGLLHHTMWYLGDFDMAVDKNVDLKPPKPRKRTLVKMSSCGSFYIRNSLLSSKNLVYMWVEPYLSNSLYKSFQTMVWAIESPMQWRPSNRKLSVCLTGNEINKAYSNIKPDCCTLDLVLFCDTFELEQQFEIIARKP